MNDADPERSERRDRQRLNISENTGVRLGLIVVILGAIVSVLGFAGGAVWWGAVQSTKLDALLVDVRAMRDEKTVLTARVDRLENTTGSMLALKEMRDGQVKSITDRLDHLESKFSGK